ncbi:hypothetical protein PoB_000435000 [Plakobranchus ocellatus]|uniref:Mediator of RNA polymerase II transcription subunit 19 n=1 Tax=Plakobranchus ocellatus TaxID=259542 RepID=A0AAV3Y5V1_9GAST|nr:hypothetical protein PoB_000435000 [Plakobranchus ocellatus]
MASSSAAPHDPMYNFDTHFPDRLSRLHLHGDLHSPSGSFRRKKGRAVRNNARYKTQPVTFDEIKEVDEEPGTGAGSGDKDGATDLGSSGERHLAGAGGMTAVHLMGQLQAFSRSMDGLLPKTPVGGDAHFPVIHFSHSRSGSRKFQRHPDCIPERAEAEQQQQQQQQKQQQQQQQPQMNKDAAHKGEQQTRAEGSTQQESGADRLKQSPLAAKAPLAVPESLSPPEAEVPHLPTPSPNMAPRRQKITAKAKKRQKAAADGED